MSNPSFAWVKVVNAYGSKPKLTPCTGTVSACVNILSGDRPPRVAAVRQATAGSAAGGNYPSGVSECCDAGYQRLTASAHEHGELSIDPAYTGEQFEQVEVIQVIGTHDDALAWLASPPGQTWSSNAKSVALMRFDLPGAASANAGGALPPYGEKYPSGDGCGFYPEKDWRSQYLRHVASDSVLFDDAQLKALFAAALVELAPSDVKNECDEVARMTKGQYARLGDIIAQASDMAAMKHVVKPRDSLLNKPATLKLLSLLMQGLRRPIFELKWHYSRGRPWTCCKDLELAFDKDDEYFPTHAAYPAGHATFATATALLMGQALPQFKTDFASRALEVADNRVIGGFHWPSDNVAGAKLAVLAVAQLGARADIQQLLVEITREWSTP